MENNTSIGPARQWTGYLHRSLAAFFVPFGPLMCAKMDAMMVCWFTCHLGCSTEFFLIHLSTATQSVAYSPVGSNDLDHIHSNQFEIRRTLSKILGAAVGCECLMLYYIEQSLWRCKFDCCYFIHTMRTKNPLKVWNHQYILEMAVSAELHECLRKIPRNNGTRENPLTLWGP